VVAKLPRRFENQPAEEYNGFLLFYPAAEAAKWEDIMRKATLNAIVDGLMLAVGVGVVATGLLLWLAIGRGPDPELPKWLLGLHRHGWGDVHLALALSLTALAALHTILHAAWIEATSRRLLDAAGWTVVLVGIGAGLVLLAATYAVERIAVSQDRYRHTGETGIERPAGTGGGRRRRRGGP